MTTLVTVLLGLTQFVLFLGFQSTLSRKSVTPPLPNRIDTHSHLVPPFYSDLLRSRNIRAHGRGIPSWNVSAHLSLNEQIGVSTSILSISAPGAKISEDSPVEDGRALARQLNEYAYNVTQEYPNKFMFFATLTLPDLEGAVEEAIYALDTLKAAGVIVMATAFGERFGTRRYAPLYKVLNERNATVFIHPSNAPCYGDNLVNTDFADLPPFMIDFLLDISRAAVTLVHENVVVEYPNINFMLAHSGGFLSFAAGRAAGALSLLADEPLSLPLFYEIYEKLKTFSVDLASSAAETSLSSITNFFYPSHITFGSDYPCSTIADVLENTDGLARFNLPGGVKESINILNAQRMFRSSLTNSHVPSSAPNSLSDNAGLSSNISRAITNLHAVPIPPSRTANKWGYTGFSGDSL